MPPARKFYQAYSPLIQQTLLAKFENDVLTQIGQSPSTQLHLFTLSWSHYLILRRIADEQEHRFYEINQMTYLLPKAKKEMR